MYVQIPSSYHICACHNHEVFPEQKINKKGLPSLERKTKTCHISIFLPQEQEQQKYYSYINYIME